MNSIILGYKDFFKESHKNTKLFLVILLLASISAAAYNILQGIYLMNLGFTEAFIGEILSLRTLGIAFGSIPIAILADRIGKKGALKTGLIMMLFGGLLMINVKISLIMKVSSFIFGIGQATLMILQAPILFDNSSDKNKVTAFSSAFVIQNLAFVFGSVILGHLSEYLSKIYDTSFANLIVLNVATIIIIVPIVLTRYFSGASMLKHQTLKGLKVTVKEVVSGYKVLLKGQSFNYLLQVGIIGFGAGLIVPFFSMYLKYALTISDGMVGTIMSISQVGTIIGGLLVPVLSKRWGRVKTVLACQLLSIPFLISIAMPQGLVLITVSFFFRSSLMNMANPIISTLAMDLVDSDQRTFMSSLKSLVNNLFRSFGIFIGGIVMYNISYNAPYYMTIGCYLIGTAIFYSVFKQKK